MAEEFIPKTGKRKSYQIKNRHLLTNKQKVFIAEYLVDFDIKRAAMAAGVPEKSAHIMGSKWLDRDKFPEIAFEIRKAIEQRKKETEIDAKRVLKEIASIALINPKKMLNSDGTVKDLKDMDDEVAAAISSFNVRYTIDSKTGEKKVKGVDVNFWNKLDALKQLAQHLGIIGGDVVNNFVNINWDGMLTTTSPQDLIDGIEQRILEVQNKPKSLPEPTNPSPSIDNSTNETQE